MKNIHYKYIILYIIGAVFIFIGILILYLWNTPYGDKFIGNQKVISVNLYYRDTLDLKDFLPSSMFEDESKKIQLYFSNDNIGVTDDYKIFLDDPNKINPAQIKSNIVIVPASNTDVTHIDISFQFWKDDELYLKEITPNIKLKKSKLQNIYNRIGNRLCNQVQEDKLMFTENGVSYISNGSDLYRLYGDQQELITKDFPLLEHAFFYQMIKNDYISFLRTGNDIYESRDNLISWRKIYSGPRGIKESMLWDETDSTLLISQYTPGTVRIRHHVLKYSPVYNIIDTIFTTYTRSDRDSLGLTPIARHMHVLKEDPYTGDIYLGCGDDDDECAIYVKKNGSCSFELNGGGSQLWRTLTFLFDKDYIYFNTDSHYPQYLTRLDKNSTDSAGLAEITRFPLFGSALWCIIDDNDSDLVLMSSNAEGCLYDTNHRIYGIRFGENGIPVVYNLFEEPTLNSWSHQLFPLGKDCNGVYWFYDTVYNIVRQFILENSNNESV